MPVIKLETNAIIPEERTRPLSRSLAVAVSKLSGHPQNDLQVELAGSRRMRMAESDEPIAHVEIKGIEYPKDRAGALAQAISAIVDEHLAIRDNMVYIAVISTRMSMWRVNGADRS